MSANGIAGVAGGFASKRFKQRRRAWRRRIWWVFPVACLPLVAAALGFGRLFAAQHPAVYVAFAAGAALVMAAVLFDSPPAHIERWRQGAEGERRTARALRRLVRNGWTLINDVDTGHGNIDHILIGPPGVFMLESKNLHGDLSVRSGVLTVQWHEDPDDGYENARIARHARGCAAQARGMLGEHGLAQWVQPVVVLWGTFAQRSISSDGVAWVQGHHLAKVLEARPAKLSAQEVARAANVAAALSSAPASAVT